MIHFQFLIFNCYVAFFEVFFNNGTDCCSVGLCGGRYRVEFHFYPGEIDSRGGENRERVVGRGGAF